jgi:acyl carrier protein
MTSAFDSLVLNKVALAVGQVTHIDPAKITAGDRLAEDLALGMFGRFRLAVCLEEAFDLELPNEVVAQFITIGDAARYLSRHYFRDFPVPLRAAAA